MSLLMKRPQNLETTVYIRSVGKITTTVIFYFLSESEQASPNDESSEGNHEQPAPIADEAESQPKQGTISCLYIFANMQFFNVLH